jgi:hypothetical protein
VLQLVQVQHCNGKHYIGCNFRVFATRSEVVAGSLLDSTNYNNQRYQAWESISREIGTPEYHAMTENLNDFADSIRASALKLQTYLTDLIAQIEKYLDR